jgi:hypothetical protein
MSAADEANGKGESQRLPPGEIDLHRCILSVRNQFGPETRELPTSAIYPN